MLRFLPYLIVLSLVLAACSILLRRGGPRRTSIDWESKYREIFERYRELTRQLKHLEDRGESRANRLRQTLLELEVLLKNERSNDAPSVRTALARIEAALKDVA